MLPMAIFSYRRFSQWIWPRVLFFWRCVESVFYLILGSTRKVLTWRKGSGGRQDDGPERPAESDCEGREVGPDSCETDPRQLSMYEKLIITNKYVYYPNIYLHYLDTRSNLFAHD